MEIGFLGFGLEFVCHYGGRANVVQMTVEVGHEEEESGGNGALLLSPHTVFNTICPTARRCVERLVPRLFSCNLRCRTNVCVDENYHVILRAIFHPTSVSIVFYFYFYNRMFVSVCAHLD